MAKVIGSCGLSSIEKHVCRSEIYARHWEALNKCKESLESDMNDTGLWNDGWCPLSVDQNMWANCCRTWDDESSYRWLEIKVFIVISNKNKLVMTLDISDFTVSLCKNFGWWDDRNGRSGSIQYMQMVQGTYFPWISFASSWSRARKEPWGYDFVTYSTGCQMPRFFMFQ